jgi:hypothetical protein
MAAMVRAADTAAMMESCILDRLKAIEIGFEPEELHRILTGLLY